MNLVTKQHVLSSLTLQIDQADLGLSRKYIIKGLENEIVKAYYDYMVDTAVTQGAEVDRARREMLDVFNLQSALANVHTQMNFIQ